MELYKRTLEEQEKILKKRLKGNNEIQDMILNHPGWKHLEKWIRYCIDVWATTDRVRQIKVGKEYRDPTLEEIAIWNLKFESRVYAFQFLLWTLSNLEAEKTITQEDLEYIKKIKEGK